MVYKIEWRQDALKELGKLDNSVRIQINKFIKKLASRDNPRIIGEALKDNLSAYWRYRVGDYRIIAEIQDDKFVILVVGIDHRKQVYKKDR